MIANVSATIRSRGLGLAAVLALPFAFVGCSSGGDIATPTLIQNRPAHRGLRLRPRGLRVCEDAARGRWPAALLQGGDDHGREPRRILAGGRRERRRGTLSAAGSNTSTAIPALTGTPTDPFSIKIVVTTAGANISAVPVTKVSLDGGLTYYALGAPAVSATPQAIGDTGLLLGGPTAPSSSMISGPRTARRARRRAMPRARACSPSRAPRATPTTCG